MNEKEIDQFIQDMPDEVLSTIQFSVPWQHDPYEDSFDPDGFETGDRGRSIRGRSVSEIQEECWSKFNRNPQVNTAIRGLVGRICGLGFEIGSEEEQVQAVIDEIEFDPRNRLYNYWPKYVARRLIEGELFLILTVHEDGFIEVDFLGPESVGGEGTDGSGIVFHPRKSFMPLFYNVQDRNGNTREQIPSIFVARYPGIINELTSSPSKDYPLNGYRRSMQSPSRSRKRVYQRFGGYYRFIVSWDGGFMTRRAISYLRTTLEWLNHYEALKKYEIDHKKSAGAYLWVFKIEDAKSFKNWLAMSDAERRKTGIMAKKTPGGSLVLPPGISVDVVNPNLTQIKEQDTDILEMIASGMNEPADVMTGTAKGTYGSIKASRGPMSDRTSDEIAWFDRFLKYDFYGSIFFLKSALGKFPQTIKVREAVRFDEKGNPVFENRKKRPEHLIEVNYPISESIDYEARLSLLGVKHGPISEVLGVPHSEVARRIGFGNYGRARLRHATEKDKYPELVYTADQEAIQEKAEAEPGIKKKPTPKKEKK